VIPLGVLASARVASSGVVLTDNFNRANSTSIGAAWQEMAGDWSIDTNALRAPVGTGNHVKHLTPLSTNDQYAQTALAAGNGAPGLILRYTDANNYLFGLAGTGAYQIHKMLSGATTLLATLATSPSYPMTLRFEAEGTALRLYRNGSLVLSTTDATVPAANYVGLRNGAGGTFAIFDDFEAGDL